MKDARYRRIGEMMRNGVSDRRSFIVRAAALGVPVQAAQAFVANPAGAQDTAPPADTVLTPDTLGVAGIEHRTDTSRGNITFYSSWPMSGASEQFGEDLAEAVRFAIDIHGGAAGGYSITYEALDDGIAAADGAWDPDQERDNATMAASDEDAMVYIGTYNSGAAEVAIPVTNTAGLAMISPGNTAVALTKASDTNPEGYPDALYPSGARTYMRVCPTDEVQGAAGADFAMSDLGAQKAWILHDGQIYGNGVAQIFRDTFERLGGEILGFDGYDPDADDYQALMGKIASSKPDIVYVGAIVNLNVPRLLKDMRQEMPANQVAFMGPDGLFNQSLIVNGEDAADRAYITSIGLPPVVLDQRGVAWYRGMTDRLGHEPNLIAMYAFEAAVVALQAIDAVGEKDRARILEHMITMTGFRGMMDTWSFTETGDTTSTAISMNQVRFGHFLYQDVVAPPE